MSASSVSFLEPVGADAGLIAPQDPQLEMKNTTTTVIKLQMKSCISDKKEAGEDISQQERQLSSTHRSNEVHSEAILTGLKVSC